MFPSRVLPFIVHPVVATRRPAARTSPQAEVAARFAQLAEPEQRLILRILQTLTGADDLAAEGCSAVGFVHGI